MDNYQDANAFLPEFFQSYNRKFAVLPRSSNNLHLPLDPTIDLDFLFSIQDTRIISKDLHIQFDNVTYQIVTNRPPNILRNVKPWSFRMTLVLFPLSSTISSSP